MEDKINKAIDDLREKKVPFSLFTLVNKYKIPKEEILKVKRKLLNEENLFIYMFVTCPKCHNKIYDMEYNKELFTKNYTCYKCKAKFKMEEDNIVLTFDFRTLKERYKSI